MKSSQILTNLSFDKGLSQFINEKSKNIELPTYLEELVEMGLCLYYAENAVNKPNNIEFETIDIERWKDTKGLLEKLFSFLTGNYIEISFLKKEKSKKEIKFNNSKTHNFSVCLFSGGLDSFCGANFLLDKDLKVNLVHTATHNVMQKIARELYKKGFNKNKVNLFEAFYRFNQEVKAGYPQLRSTFFLMNGAPIMELFGTENLFIPENGVMMINPPVSGLVRWTKATRPEVLLLNQEILRIYLKKEIKINSPFYDKTKAEIISRYISKKGFNSTSSCFNYRWQKKSEKNCGRCYGCNITRLSKLALGLKEKSKEYSTNYFLVNKIPGTEKDRNELYQYSDFLDMCYNLIKDKNKLDRTQYNLINDAQNIYNSLKLKIDVWDLMKRFGLDMFVGLNNLYKFKKADPSNTILGKKFIKLINKEDIKSLMKAREDLLSSMIKKIK